MARRSQRIARRLPALERKIRLRASQCRIQGDCAPIGLARLLDAAEITKNEPRKKVCVGICGVEIDRPPKKPQRLFPKTAIVENLGEEEVKN